MIGRNSSKSNENNYWVVFQFNNLIYSNKYNDYSRMSRERCNAGTWLPSYDDRRCGHNENNDLVIPLRRYLLIEELFTHSKLDVWQANKWHEEPPECPGEYCRRYDFRYYNRERLFKNIKYRGWPSLLNE